MPRMPSSSSVVKDPKPYRATAPHPTPFTHAGPSIHPSQYSTPTQPPKPPVAPNAYSVFESEFIAEHQRRCESMGQHFDPSESCSVASALWISLPKQQKDVWKSEADALKKSMTAQYQQDKLAKHPKSDSIPRPANAYILFRSDFFHRHKESMNALASGGRTRKGSGLLQSDVSLMASTKWNGLTDAEKGPWMAKAKQAKEEHELRYPDYKFCPAPSRRGSKSSSSSQIA